MNTEPNLSSHVCSISLVCGNVYVLYSLAVLHEFTCMCQWPYDGTDLAKDTKRRENNEPEILGHRVGSGMWLGRKLHRIHLLCLCCSLGLNRVLLQMHLALELHHCNPHSPHCCDSLSRFSVLMVRYLSSWPTNLHMKSPDVWLIFH